jgi:cytochrome c553
MRLRLASVPLLLCCLLSTVTANDSEIFENNCAACHGVDGRARTPQGKKLKARDLKESRLSDEDLLRRIREGSRTPAGSWLMPAFADKLTPAEIEASARHAKTFRPAEPSRPEPGSAPFTLHASPEWAQTRRRPIRSPAPRGP